MADLIERQAAIDAVHEEFDECLVWDESGRYTADEVERILDRVPSAQPRKGKWIGYKADDKDWQRDDGSPVFMNCSECHEAVINNGSAHWNFCPNCGSYNGGNSDDD